MKEENSNPVDKIVAAVVTSFHEAIAHRAQVASAAREAPQRDLLDIFDWGNLIGALNDPQEILVQSLNLMMEVAYGELGVLDLLDAKTDESGIRAVKGCLESSQVIGLRINRPLGATDQAVEERGVIISYDLSRERRTAFRYGLCGGVNPGHLKGEMKRG